jgi:hypothetical protein
VSNGVSKPFFAALLALFAREALLYTALRTAFTFESAQEFGSLYLLTYRRTQPARYAPLQ